MNWGNRIVLAFALFAVFILYMVVVAFQQNNDLTAEDYYAKEINYQKKMEQKANLKELGQKVVVSQTNGRIKLVFPSGHKPDGEIHFYHPSRKLFDQKVPISTDHENSQTVDRSTLTTGSYRVNITWTVDNRAYFQQEKIYIQ